MPENAYTDSDAYWAYKDFDIRPGHISLWPQNGDGLYIIQPGETICRFPVDGSWNSITISHRLVLCHTKTNFANNAGLMQHLRTHHDITKVVLSASRGRRSDDKNEALVDYYTSLLHEMRNPPSRRGVARPSQGQAQATPPQPLANIARSTSGRARGSAQPPLPRMRPCAPAAAPPPPRPTFLRPSPTTTAASSSTDTGTGTAAPRSASTSQPNTAPALGYSMSSMPPTRPHAANTEARPQPSVRRPRTGPSYAWSDAPVPQSAPAPAPVPVPAAASAQAPNPFRRGMFVRKPRPYGPVPAASPSASTLSDSPSDGPRRRQRKRPRIHDSSEDDSDIEEESKLVTKPTATKTPAKKSSRQHQQAFVQDDEDSNLDESQPGSPMDVLLDINPAYTPPAPQIAAPAASRHEPVAATIAPSALAATAPATPRAATTTTTLTYSAIITLPISPISPPPFGGRRFYLPPYTDAERANIMQGAIDDGFIIPEDTPEQKALWANLDHMGQ